MRLLRKQPQAVIFLLLLTSCEDAENISDELITGNKGIVFNDKDFTTDDFSQETHGKLIAPNFSEVFPNDEVKRINIIINSDRWDLMMNNMTSLYGEPDQGGRPGGPPGGLDDDENPIMVPADIFYKDKQWYRVGVRFKGNSSLKSTW